MPWLILGGGLIAALVIYSTGPGSSRSSGSGTGTRRDSMNLQHFTPDEFRQWWPEMNQELLQKLDAFREAWGHPVRISPAEGSLGRHDGEFGTSQHNVDAWGEVRAADVFPMVPAGASGYRYLVNEEERRRAYETARAVGFTGIGLYTDTSPGNMLHVDVRPTAEVATWSRVNGQYLGIGQVLA